MASPFLHLIAQENVNGTLMLIDKIARTPMSVVLMLAAGCTAYRLAVAKMMKSTPAHQRTGTFKFLRFVNEAADAIVYASVLVFLIVRPFAIQTFVIPTGSMIDTLRINDMILLNKFVYRFNDPKHGDIVVFNPPKEGQDPAHPNTDYIKRLIGEPGDIIEIRNQKLFRNGKPVNEAYEARTQVGPSGSFTDLITVPKNEWSLYMIPDFKLVEYQGKIIPLQIVGEQVNNSGATAPAFRFSDTATMLNLKDLPPAPIPKGYYLFMGDNRNGSYDGRSWGIVPRDSIVGKYEFTWAPFNRWGKAR